jgi:hypothetical protein
MNNEFAILRIPIGSNKTIKLMVKIVLAPKRFVQYPIGTLSKDPRITGTAVAKDICVDDSLISAWMYGISDEISTQTIKPATRLVV